MNIDPKDLESDDYPFSNADYEAIKEIAKRNGGEITYTEIFSVTVRGYLKLSRIVDSLKKEGIIVINDQE